MNLDELKQKDLDAIYHFDIKDAAMAAKDIEAEINNSISTQGNNREEMKEYNQLLARLRLLTLPLLKDEEAIRLIKGNMVELIHKFIIHKSRKTCSIPFHNFWMLKTR